MKIAFFVNKCCLASIAVAMTITFSACSKESKNEKPIPPESKSEVSKPATPSKTEEPKAGAPAITEVPSQRLPANSGEPRKEVPFEVKQTSVEGLKEVVTESGLKYWDIKVGDGPSPASPTSAATVHFSGWLTDGTLFISTLQRVQPAPTYRLDKDVIKGWTEGILTMKRGGKRRLEIPPQLAYGETGKPPKVPPNATLIFEIELVSFVNPPPPPKPTPVEGLKETTTGTGLKYWDIKVGTGAEPTKPTAYVTIHYIGWLKSDGTMFDSTVARGVPAKVILDSVMDGWTEGISSMKVGGKRLMEIPPSLAYGEKGTPTIPPNATLIFEIELIDVKN